MAMVIFNDGSNTSGSMGLQTADNGLTANTATNVQLGGDLLADTTVTPNGNSLILGPVTITDGEATCSAAPVNPTDLVRLEDLGTSGPVASNKVTGVMASGILITYPVPGTTDLQYRINTWGKIRVLPGAGTLTINVSYTDNAGDAQTFGFTSINTALEATANPSTIIEALHGTNIVISQVLTGGGIIADFSSSIEFIF